jgi:hypothetical protein
MMSLRVIRLPIAPPERVAAESHCQTVADKPHRRHIDAVTCCRSPRTFQTMAALAILGSSNNTIQRTDASWIPEPCRLNFPIVDLNEEVQLIVRANACCGIAFFCATDASLN